MSTHNALNTRVDAAASRFPAPYEPRRLSRAELKRKDVYAFVSPKLDRDVWLTGALTFAASLKFEFDVDVLDYCERPRTIQLPNGQTTEVAYWTRHANGEEHLWLLVPVLESDPAAGGSRRYRHEREALEAAQSMQVSLRFLFESELVAAGVSISTWLGLLPYVQTAHVMDNFAAIESRVAEHFRFAMGTTFAQLGADLSAFNAHDVRSVVCRGIHEGWLAIDPTRQLHIHTVVRGRAP